MIFMLIIGAHWRHWPKGDEQQKKKKIQKNICRVIYAKHEQKDLDPVQPILKHYHFVEF